MTKGFELSLRLSKTFPLVPSIDLYWSIIVSLVEKYSRNFDRTSGAFAELLWISS